MHFAVYLFPLFGRLFFERGQQALCFCIIIGGKLYKEWHKGARVKEKEDKNTPTEITSYLAKLNNITSARIKDATPGAVATLFWKILRPLSFQMCQITYIASGSSCNLCSLEPLCLETSHQEHTSVATTARCTMAGESPWKRSHTSFAKGHWKAK
jgi:hypothetical protein